MPFYTYQCKKCSKIFEDVSQKITEASFKKHKDIEKDSKCNGEVERLLHPSGFNFKGTGFYITDYKNKKDS